MGKVKRPRQKYHLARAKSMNDLTTIEPAVPSLPDYDVMNMSLPQYSVSDNLFAGLDIPTGSNARLVEDDGKSIVSTKSSFKDRNLTKKQKRDLRHEAFIRKLEVVHQARREGRDRKRHPKMEGVVDMKTLADALPSIEIFKRTKRPHPTYDEAARKSLQKANVRHYHAMRDIDTFLWVSNDPGYLANPSAAISNFIQEKVRKELIGEEGDERTRYPSY